MSIKNIAASAWAFLKEEDGPTSVEYAVMLGLILVAVLVGVGAVGVATQGRFQESSDAINGAFAN